MAIVASTLGGFEDTSKTPPDTAFMTDSERIDHELAYGVVTPKKKGQIGPISDLLCHIGATPNGSTCHI